MEVFAKNIIKGALFLLMLFSMGTVFCKKTEQTPWIGRRKMQNPEIHLLMRMLTLVNYILKRIS